MNLRDLIKKIGSGVSGAVSGVSRAVQGLGNAGVSKVQTQLSTVSTPKFNLTQTSVATPKSAPISFSSVKTPTSNFTVRSPIQSTVATPTQPKVNLGNLNTQNIKPLVNALTKTSGQSAQLTQNPKTNIPQTAKNFVSGLAQSPVVKFGQTLGMVSASPIVSKQNKQASQQYSSNINTALKMASQAKTPKERQRWMNLAKSSQNLQSGQANQFQQQYNKTPQQIVGEGLGTAATLIGGPKLTPKTALGIAGISGGLNKVQGGSFAEGAGTGLAYAPVFAGITKYTNPILAKAVGSSPAQNVITQHLTSGIANVGQGLVSSAATGQKPTPLSVGLDFGIGAIGGKSQFETPNVKGFKTNTPKFDDQTVLEVGKLANQAETNFIKKVPHPAGGLKDQTDLNAIKDVDVLTERFLGKVPKNWTTAQKVKALEDAVDAQYQPLGLNLAMGAKANEPQTGIARKTFAQKSQVNGEVKLPDNTQAASVPVMITRDMKQQLSDLGYKNTEINKLNPTDAGNIIKNQITKTTQQTGITLKPQSQNLEDYIAGKKPIDQLNPEVKSTKMVFGTTEGKVPKIKTTPEQQTILDQGTVKNVSLDNNNKVPIGSTSKYNVGKIKTKNPEVVKQAVEEVRPAFEKLAGEGPLTHEQIIKKSELAHTELIKVIGSKTTEELGAAQLRLRQNIAKMADTGTVTPDLLEAMRTDAAFARSNAQLLGQRGIEAQPNTEIGATMLRYIESVNKVANDIDAVVAKAKGVDFSDPNQASEFYRSFIAPTAGDWVDRVRFASMLSSPTTAIVNFSTNLQGTGLLTPLEKTVTGLVDKFTSSITGNQREHFTGEGAKFAQGYVSNFKSGVTNFISAMKGGSGMSELHNIPLTKPGTIARLGENTLTFFPKLAQATDEFFNALTQGGLKAANEYRISKGGTAQTGSEIAGEAARRLFNQPFGSDQSHILNAIEYIPSKIMNATHSTNPFVKWTAKFSFPFVRIPANIFKAGIEYSPLGYTTMWGANNKQEQLSKALLGTATAMGAWMLAQNDRLTFGMPNSEKQRDAMTAAGIPPYSVDVTGKGDWVQYTKFHPIIGFNMALASAIKNQMDNQTIDDSSLETVMGIASNWFSYFADQSYMKQMGSFLDIAKGNETAVARAASSYPQQLVPFRAFGGWLAKAFDPYERKIDPDGSKLNQGLQNIMLSIPGLRNNLPERTDSNFQPVEQQNRLTNLFSPSKISSEVPVEAQKYRDLKQSAIDTKVATAIKNQTNKGKEFGATTGPGLTLNDKQLNSVANSLGLGKVASMPEVTKLEQVAKKDAGFAVAKKIIDSDYDDNVKSELLNAMGLDTDTAKFYTEANKSADYRTAFMEQELADIKNTNEAIKIITKNMKTVNGKAIASDEVITNLQDNGLIGAGLAKWLKKLKWNESSQSWVSSSLGGSGTGAKKKFSLSSLPSMTLQKFGNSTVSGKGAVQSVKPVDTKFTSSSKLPTPMKEVQGPAVVKTRIRLRNPR